MNKQDGVMVLGAVSVIFGFTLVFGVDGFGISVAVIGFLMLLLSPIYFSL